MEQSSLEIIQKVPKAELDDLLEVYKKYTKQNKTMGFYFIPLMLVVAYHNFFVAGKSFYPSELDKIITIEVSILLIVLVFIFYNLVTSFIRTKKLKSGLLSIHNNYQIEKYQVEEEFKEIATNLHGGTGFPILAYKERIARMKEMENMKDK